MADVPYNTCSFCTHTWWEFKNKVLTVVWLFVLLSWNIVLKESSYVETYWKVGNYFKAILVLNICVYFFTKIKAKAFQMSPFILIAAARFGNTFHKISISFKLSSNEGKVWLLCMCNILFSQKKKKMLNTAENTSHNNEGVLCATT